MANSCKNTNEKGRKILIIILATFAFSSPAGRIIVINMSDEKGVRIGLLGTGQMGRALAKAWIRSGLVSPDRLIGFDPDPAARERFNAETGAEVLPLVGQQLQQVDLIILAMKPNQLADGLNQIKHLVQPRHLVVSIVAGIPTRKIEEQLFDGVRVVRVMPNTPALVRAMAGAYSAGRWATAEDLKLVEQLFSALGLLFQVKETLMDAVTGLSGSGPAFCAMVIEALADGGVAAGLPRDVALQLAAQTVLGSAKMVLERGLHPALLKDMVCSPAGTTIAGVEQLEAGAVRASVMRAVLAAARRAEELGRACLQKQCLP